jgi:hypothetical protein
VSNQTNTNEDWVKRDGGRILSKGAMAAERASAGLGTSDDDDAAFLGDLRPGVSLWAKTVRKRRRPDKQ